MKLGTIGNDKPYIKIANVLGHFETQEEYILIGVKKQNWFMRKFFNKQKEYTVICFIQAPNKEAIIKSFMLKNIYESSYTKKHLFCVKGEGLIWREL